jgi:hypothetical protein
LHENTSTATVTDRVRLTSLSAVEDRKYIHEVPQIHTDSSRCGCVVAGRLANLDHNLQVLLIEGGENNLNNPWVYRPGIYPRNMKLDSKTASFYYSRPSEWLDGRRAVVPCAHILGGGSSINFMVSVVLVMLSTDLILIRCTLVPPLPTTMTSRPRAGLPRSSFP